MSDTPTDYPPISWAEIRPLPPARPAPPAFDYELLPDALRPWVRDVAERIQCPPDFCAVTALWALGVAVGRRLGIRPKERDDWTVIPNLWGVLVGRPSVMKSPAMKEMLRPLHRIEAEAKRAHESDQADFAAMQLVAEARRKAAAKKLDAAAKKGDADDDELADLARQASAAETDAAPSRRRYVTNDATHETLGVLSAENPAGIGIVADELKRLLASLERAGHEDARGFLLEGWNGDGRYATDRIGRGNVEADALCLSLIGGIQPGPLASFLRGAVKGGEEDDGLMQRFSLAVWPEVAAEWRDVDRWPDSEARTRAHDVYQTLAGLTREQLLDVGAEADDEDGVPFLRFDAGGLALFRDWRTGMENRTRAGDMNEAMEAHLTKYRKLVPAVALLTHLADWAAAPDLLSVLAVPAVAVSRAILWAEYLEAHARRLYAEEVESAIPAAHGLLDKINSGVFGRPGDDGTPVRFDPRTVYRKGWSRLTTPEAVAEAAAVLIECGWLAEVDVTDTGGRDGYELVVNPAVWSSDEEEKAQKVRKGVLPELTKAPSVGSVGSVSTDPDASTPRNGHDRTDRPGVRKVRL